MGSQVGVGAGVSVPTTVEIVFDDEDLFMAAWVQAVSTTSIIKKKHNFFILHSFHNWPGSLRVNETSTRFKSRIFASAPCNAA